MVTKTFYIYFIWTFLKDNGLSYERVVSLLKEKKPLTRKEWSSFIHFLSIFINSIGPISDALSNKTWMISSLLFEVFMKTFWM